MHKAAAAVFVAFNVASGTVQAAGAPTIESVADCLARSEPKDTAQCQADKLSKSDQVKAMREAWRKVRSGEVSTGEIQAPRSGIVIQDSPGAIVDDQQFPDGNFMDSDDGAGVIINNSPGAVVGHGNKRTVIINGKTVSP